MNDSAGTAHYTSLAKWLHWLVAGGIVLQFVLAELAENAEHAGERVSQLGLLANHKSVGMTVLVLALLRLFWRVTHRAPALPATMARWQRAASHVSHVLLYGLIVLVPLTGWLMSSASAYSVSWFNLFQFPDLIGANADTKHLLEDTHETLAKLLFVIAVVHIAAAFKHLFFDKDGVMGRITSGPALGIFAAILVAGLLTLTRVGGNKATAAPSDARDAYRTAADSSAEIDASPKATSEPAPDTVSASSLPVWIIDSDASRISFTGDQAGASFTGQWPTFVATLQFDEEQLDDARFDVTIDTTSPDTGDEERDTTMVDSDWFDSANHAEAMYRAQKFERTDTGFVAQGQLLIKKKSQLVPLSFAVTTDGERRILNGTASIDRLAFDLGTGDWSDTTWVGQNVEVEVHIEAQIGGE